MVLKNIQINNYNSLHKIFINYLIKCGKKSKAKKNIIEILIKLSKINKNSNILLQNTINNNIILYSKKYSIKHNKKKEYLYRLLYKKALFNSINLLLKNKFNLNNFKLKNALNIKNLELYNINSK